MVLNCTCGAKLRVKPEAAGRHARCPKCSHTLLIPHAPARDSVETAPLDLLEQLSAGPAQTATTPENGLYRLPGETSEPAPWEPARPQPVNVGYARDAGVAPRRERTGYDEVRGPARTFWADLFYAFVYPVAKFGNAFNSVFIAIVGVAGLASGNMVGLRSVWVVGAGIVIWVGIHGWLASMYMNIITNTASGSDDVPGPTMDVDWVDDMLAPAVKYLIAIALSGGPALLYMFLYMIGVAEPLLPILIAALVYGVLAFPIVMLLISMDMGHMVLRPNLILTTLGRTFLPYVVVCAAFLLAQAGRFWMWYSPPGSGASAPSPDPTDVFAGMRVAATVDVVSTFFMLVSMRLIGLYYLHFKRRFAFKME